MKKVFIAVVVMGALLISLGLFFIFRTVTLPQVETTASVVPDVELEVPASEFSGRDSILNLALLNKSMQCAFVFREDDYKGEGTAFFDGGKARIDSLYSYSSTDLVASFMILNHNSAEEYFWSLKDKMTDVNKVVAGEEEDHGDMVSLSTVVQYVCHDWVVDGSVFVPPNEKEGEAGTLFE